MAFTSSVETQVVVGNRRIVTGTFTNTSGSTGGDVNVPLAVVEFFNVVQRKSAVTTGVPVVNETAFPTAGPAITIVTDADEDGNWWAIGF